MCIRDRTCIVNTNNADASGTVTFSIAFSDIAGIAGDADSTVDDASTVAIDNTHPTLGTVGIVDAGDGNANNGDSITLTFTATETIQTPVCTIKDGAGDTMANTVAVNNPSGNVWTCIVATADSDADGTVTFSIAYTDANGNVGDADTSVDDGSTVTIDNTHPTLGTVGIASNNGNPALSIDGNTVTVTFTATETIGTPTCDMEFAGTDATNAESITNTGGNVWTCAVVSHDSDADGAVSFSIVPTDTAGNAGVAESTVDDSSSVTHDDTLPTLGTVAIASNNGNTALSIDGNTVTVTFTASETLSSATCDMEFNDVDATNTETVSYSGANNIWTCAVVSHDSDADGTVSFSIVPTDAAGIAGAADESVDDSSTMTHDDTVPTLSLVGITTDGTGNANNGDDVTLTFKGSETLGTPTCTMKDGAGDAMGNAPAVSHAGSNVWNCVVSTADADADGAMTYSIAFADAAGNSGVAVTSGTGSVTIDNSHPTMSPVSMVSNNGCLLYTSDAADE